MTARRASDGGGAGRWRDYLELTKPRITSMVVVTAAAGYLVGSPGAVDLLGLLSVLTGTALVAAGASAWNQVAEWRRDARMQRTAQRPLPAGRLVPAEALVFAAGLATLGLAALALLVNPLTAALAAASLLSYVFVYTPMKPHSSLATVVGAVPGAIPPVMGYTAAQGGVDAVAGALFGLLFLWQMPHFLAIAWLCRQDYARGGFPMLTVDDHLGHRTSRQVIFYAGALVPVSLLPSVLGATGGGYLLGALLLGGAFVACSLAFAMAQTLRAARRLLLASVLYLPFVLALMVVDQAG